MKTDSLNDNKENIVFNNRMFAECWKELTHKEDVEIKRSKLIRYTSLLYSESIISFRSNC